MIYNNSILIPSDTEYPGFQFEETPNISLVKLLYFGVTHVDKHPMSILVANCGWPDPPRLCKIHEFAAWIPPNLGASNRQSLLCVKATVFLAETTILLLVAWLKLFVAGSSDIPADQNYQRSMLAVSGSLIWHFLKGWQMSLFGVLNISWKTICLKLYVPFCWVMFN